MPKPIEQSHTLRASTEDVFAALTESSELDRWWTTSSESEPRAGGRFLYRWEFPENPEKDHRQEGVYAEVRSGSRIRYPWAVGPASTEVTFDLARADEGTELRLTHTGWADGMEEARRMHDEGWRMFLGNLKSVLEEGEDRRAATIGMKVSGAASR